VYIYMCLYINTQNINNYACIYMYIHMFIYRFFGVVLTVPAWAVDLVLIWLKLKSLIVLSLILKVNMYVHMYLYIYIYIYIYIYVYIYVHLWRLRNEYSEMYHIYMYRHIRIHKYICTQYIYMYIYTYGHKDCF
jgi:hypothetical protein